jgi:hypothetical protein
VPLAFHLQPVPPLMASNLGCSHHGLVFSGRMKWCVLCASTAGYSRPSFDVVVVVIVKLIVKSVPLTGDSNKRSTHFCLLEFLMTVYLGSAEAASRSWILNDEFVSVNKRFMY